MNLDPRNSRNYKKSLRLCASLNQGALFQVGDEMLTANQIAEIANCSIQSVNKWIKQRGENPDRFINRMRKRFENNI